MKKSYLVYQVIFGVIVAVSFAIGVGMNPGFDVFEFFAGLCVEIVGWVLGVTIFQLFYDRKLAARRANAKQPAKTDTSIADELTKLKALLDSGAITEEEFQTLKGRLLAKEA